MLPLPELTQSDSRLPFAGTSTKQGLQSKDGAELPARGFAEMLTAAVPPKGAGTTTSGELLPAGGKELPLWGTDTAGELPTGISEGVNSDAVASAVQALPEVPDDLLQGGMPQIEPNVETPVTTDPVVVEQSTKGAMDAELAALQLMLPPLNPAAEVAAEAAAANPAQTLTVSVAARGLGLAGNNGDGTAVTRAASNGRAYTAIPGLAMSEGAVVNGRSNEAPVLAATPPVPAESSPLLRDSLNPAMPAAATADIAAVTGKEFAELLSGGKDVRLDPHDTLPRIQPMAAAAPAASLSSPAPALPAAAAAINLPVTDARWGDALGERVTWMAGQKLDSAEIRLNPAELGPIRIKITMEENQAQVTFTAQHAVTREAIEQALPRLRELFTGEGLNLSNADVNGDGVRHDQDGSGRGDDRFNGNEQLRADADEDDGLVMPTVRVSNNLVDTFA
ncbi:MAG: flagellar hook-length control protein FliK [Woeseia sp.]